MLLLLPALILVLVVAVVVQEGFVNAVVIVVVETDARAIALCLKFESALLLVSCKVFGDLEILSNLDTNGILVTTRASTSITIVVHAASFPCLDLLIFMTLNQVDLLLIRLLRVATHVIAVVEAWHGCCGVVSGLHGFDHTATEQLDFGLAA